jgi:hypothetical protein
MGIGRAAVGVLLEKAAAGPFFGRDLQRSAHHLSDRSGGARNSSRVLGSDRYGTSGFAARIFSPTGAHEKAIEFPKLRTAKKCLWVGTNLR